MTNIPMTDPWMESLYKADFNTNSTDFFKKVKSLFVEERKREKKVISLLERYRKSDISVGKIAEKLNLEREDVWALMKKYKVDLVDYSWQDEVNNVDKFLAKY